MRFLRGDGCGLSALRAVALFAFLLQFTIPFGVSLAVGFDDSASSRFASICWGGLGQDGDTPDKPSHGIACPTPGGCCALGGLDRVPPPSETEITDLGLVAFEHRQDVHHVPSHDLRPEARGPPVFS